MTMYDTLLADAARLPVADRIKLIDDLWDTLPSDNLPPISGDWMTEIQRRSTEYDKGLVQTASWEQVRADALRRVGIVVSGVSG